MRRFWHSTGIPICGRASEEVTCDVCQRTYYLAG
jgi:hypothetical protein